MSNDKKAPSQPNNVYPKDDICLTITDLIIKEGKLSLNQVMEKRKLSKQTAHDHLKHLVRDGILTRQATIQGKGRPTIYYSRTEKPIKITQEEDLVSIPFKKLQSLCKKRDKYDRCTEKRRECEIFNCPAILK
jgi:predicted ArsR family transcriptional regulator